MANRTTGYLAGYTTEQKKVRLERHYRVNPDTGCWEARSRSVQGIPLKRWAYECYVGEIPEGFEVRRDPWKCNTPRGVNCINPNHLTCRAMTPEQIRFLDMVKEDREEARALQD